MANYDYCLIGSATDKGRVRKANEDRCAWFDTDNGRIGVVCDGMGGHVGGQIASQTAIDAIKEYLNTHIIESPQEAISNSITYANQAILQRASTQPELTGMGSTCVMLLIRDGRVYYGHVGDSRIYIISSRIIRQLTKDHSFVQMLVDAGQITAEQAEHHPRKNEITNALGLPNMQPPTVCIEPIEPDAGTAFLLCSDGLTGMVNDRTIEKVVSNRSVARLDDRAGELVHLANDAGGVDNISVLLVEFALGTSDILSPNDLKVGRSKKSIITIAISAVVAFSLVIAGWFVYNKFIKEPDVPDTSNTPALIKHRESIDKFVGEINFTSEKTVECKTGISSNEIIRLDSISILSPNDSYIKCTNYLLSGKDNQCILKLEKIKDFENSPSDICIEVRTDVAIYKLWYKVISKVNKTTKSIKQPVSQGRKAESKPSTPNGGIQDTPKESGDTSNEGNGMLGGMDVGSVAGLAAPSKDTTNNNDSQHKKDGSQTGSKEQPEKKPDDTQPEVTEPESETESKSGSDS